MRTGKEISLGSLMRCKPRVETVQGVTWTGSRMCPLHRKHWFRTILSPLNPVGLHEPGTDSKHIQEYCTATLQNLGWASPALSDAPFCCSYMWQVPRQGHCRSPDLSSHLSPGSKHGLPLLGLVQTPWRWVNKELPQEAVKLGAPGTLKAVLGLTRHDNR